ncbi:hypothetical protein [Hyphomonas sp.]|uniref:hypothetical protein n=1 Tax=Hyphomonas sp. TaxID=87 RepID=UPI00391DB5F3
MAEARPHPNLWRSIAQLLAVLRELIMSTAPDAFAAVSAEARARLTHLTALVRRYIHILAAETVLPPPRQVKPQIKDKTAGKPRRPFETPFKLIERPAPARAGPSRPTDGDPPQLQWALLWDAARRLTEVMADPARHARRLARYLRKHTEAPPRDLAVPWSVLRRLGAQADALLIHLDHKARPKAWENLDTS